MRCLVEAAAVVLGVEPEVLIGEIGHDGSEKLEIWNFNPPFCYRGVHIQEIQECFLRRGKCLYLIERHPCSRPPLEGSKLFFLPGKEELFFDIIHGGYGIALGERPASGIAHAGVLRDNLIFEPDGVTRYSLYDFRVRSVYLVGSK